MVEDDLYNYPAKNSEVVLVFVILSSVTQIHRAKCLSGSFPLFIKFYSLITPIGGLIATSHAILTYISHHLD